MKAKQLFEFACPAPVAPPKEKPGAAPTRERPGAPVRPSKRPNPFRRKDIKPGEEPRPKASVGGYAYEGKKLKQPAQGKKVKKAFKGESSKPSRARDLIESLR